MGKYKELLGNVGVLTISNFGSKLLAFFLIPLYTSVLSAADYGNFDIINTTIILLFPILTTNITEGAIRFLLDRNADKDTIIKKSFVFINISILVVGIILGINKVFHFIPLFEDYALFFFLHYITSTYYLAAQNISRGLDKLKNIGIAGVINSVLALGLNIVFLLALKFGLSGYFLAYIIANGLTALFLLWKSKLFAYTFSINPKNLPDDKGLTKYSRPLMINSLSWWINDASDRYFVTWICGAAANGIYSVAYKIPSILTVVQGIFNQAWLISVTKEYKHNNNRDFVKKVYRLYNSMMVILCSIIILLNKMIAGILYKGDFYDAWIFVPLLLVSVVFSSASGAIGTIFGAEKDSKALSYTTALGAIINIVLNFILISIYGVIGAAIATAAASFTVWLIRIVYCRRYIKIPVAFNDILSYLFLVVQTCLFAVADGLTLYAIEGVIVLLIFILNLGIIRELLAKIFQKGFKR